MRTLHIDTGEKMQGGQWQALYLVGGLKDAILLAPAASVLFAEASKTGVDVRPLTVLTLRKLARQVDVIHAHDAKAHTLAAVCCTDRGGAPLVVSRRVAFPIKRGIASRWKYGRAKLFLAVSKFVANGLVRAGIPQDRIRVVYDGVPIPPLSTRSPGLVVALASKPVQIPGIPVDHTTLLWEGLSLSEGLILKGLDRASVFVYKSDLEGLGSAALLAQAAGVPVVASDAGGLTEAVVDGQTGFIVEDNDFATPVKRLLEDRVLAERMGMAGHERVLREFSVDVMVRNTLSAYGELIR